MDKISQIKEKLIEVVGVKPNLPITAKVVSVDEDHCTVRLTSGLELSDVKLKATIKEETDFMLMTPAIGSSVIVMSFTGDLDNLFVVKVDQVESIEMKRNGLTIQLDGKDQKVSIKNESVSLKELFSDLSSLLRTFKVYTPAGPSNTPLPQSINAITNFELKFKQLLK